MENGTFLGEDYFERLLSEIREIRLSERRFYQKITDIYATAVDYSKVAPTTKAFFAKVQNKLHFAIHGHTAAELIVQHADSDKAHMGLASWEHAPDGKIISHTCARTRQLKLESYDRLFPNQDSMPKGGFGNLIALPLQKTPRENGCSVFVDGELRPYRDQWAYLASVLPMPAHDIETTILRATGNAHPLDVTFIDEEDQKEPWKRFPSVTKKLAGPMPKSLTVTLANLIYFERAQLPQSLANRLIRLAAFQNPELY